MKKKVLFHYNVPFDIHIKALQHRNYSEGIFLNSTFASGLRKGFIRNKVVPDFENVLQGKIQFLGMIRGKDDHYYKTFNRKFNELKKN